MKRPLGAGIGNSSLSHLPSCGGSSSGGAGISSGLGGLSVVVKSFSSQPALLAALSRGNTSSRYSNSREQNDRNSRDRSSTARSSKDESVSRTQAAMDVARRALEALHTQRRTSDNQQQVTADPFTLVGDGETPRSGLTREGSPSDGGDSHRRRRPNGEGSYQQRLRRQQQHQQQLFDLTGKNLEELEAQLLKQGRRNIRDPSLITSAVDELVRRPLVPFLALQHAQLLGDADSGLLAVQLPPIDFGGPEASALLASSPAVNPFRYAVDESGDRSIARSMRFSRFQQALLRYQKQAAAQTPSKNILSYGRLVRDACELCFSVGDYARSVELFLQKTSEGLGPYLQTSPYVVDAAFLLPTVPQALTSLRQISVALLDRLALCPSDGLAELCVYRCFWRACVLWRDVRLEMAASLNIIRAGRRKLQTEAERELERLREELTRDTSLRPEQREVLQQILAATPTGSTIEKIKANSAAFNEWPPEVQRQMSTLAAAELVGKHIYYGALCSPLMLGGIDRRAAAAFEAYWSAVVRGSSIESVSDPLSAAESVYGVEDIEWLGHQIGSRGPLSTFVTEHFNTYRPMRNSGGASKDPSHRQQKPQEGEVPLPSPQLKDGDRRALDSFLASQPPSLHKEADLQVFSSRQEEQQHAVEAPRDTCFTTLWRTTTSSVLYNDLTDDGCSCFHTWLFERLLRSKRTDEVLKAAVPTRAGISTVRSAALEGHSSTNDNNGDNLNAHGGDGVSEYAFDGASVGANDEGAVGSNHHHHFLHEMAAMENNAMKVTDNANFQYTQLAKQQLLQTSSLVQRLMQSCVADFDVEQCVRVFEWYWACCSRGGAAGGGVKDRQNPSGVVWGGPPESTPKKILERVAMGCTQDFPHPSLASISSYPSGMSTRRTIEGVVLFTFMQCLVEMKAFQKIIEYWEALSTAMRAEELTALQNARAERGEQTSRRAVEADSSLDMENKVVARSLLHKSSVVAIVARAAGTLEKQQLTVDLIQLLLDANEAPSAYEVFVCLSACARSKSPHFMRLLQVILDTKVAMISEEEQRFLKLHYFGVMPSLQYRLAFAKKTSLLSFPASSSSSAAYEAEGGERYELSDPERLVLTICDDLQVLLDVHYTRQLQAAMPSLRRGAASSRSPTKGAKKGPSYALGAARCRDEDLRREEDDDYIDDDALLDHLSYPHHSAIGLSAAEGVCSQRVLSALLSFAALETNASRLLLALFDVVDKIGGSTSSPTTAASSSQHRRGAADDDHSSAANKATQQQQQQQQSNSVAMLAWLEHLVLYANKNRYNLPHQERAFIYEQITKYGLADKGKWSLSRYVAQNVQRGTSKSYPFLREGYKALGLRYVDAPPFYPIMQRETSAAPLVGGATNHQLPIVSTNTASASSPSGGGKSLLPKAASLWDSLLKKGGGGGAKEIHGSDAAEGTSPSTNTEQRGEGQGGGGMPTNENENVGRLLEEKQHKLPILDGSRRVTVIGGPLSDSFKAQLSLFLYDYTNAYVTGSPVASPPSARPKTNGRMATSSFAAKAQQYPSSSINSKTAAAEGGFTSDKNVQQHHGLHHGLHHGQQEAVVSVSQWASANRSAVDAGLSFVGKRQGAIDIPRIGGLTPQKRLRHTTSRLTVLPYVEPSSEVFQVSGEESEIAESQLASAVIHRSMKDDVLGHQQEYTEGEGLECWFAHEYGIAADHPLAFHAAVSVARASLAFRDNREMPQHPFAHLKERGQQKSALTLLSCLRSGEGASALVKGGTVLSRVEEDFVEALTKTKIDLPPSVAYHLASEGQQPSQSTQYIFKPDFYYTAGPTQKLNEFVTDEGTLTAGERSSFPLRPLQFFRRGSVGNAVPDAEIVIKCYHEVRECIEAEAKREKIEARRRSRAEDETLRVAFLRDGVGDISNLTASSGLKSNNVVEGRSIYVPAATLVDNIDVLAKEQRALLKDLGLWSEEECALRTSRGGSCEQGYCGLSMGGTIASSTSYDEKYPLQGEGDDREENSLNTRNSLFDEEKEEDREEGESQSPLLPALEARVAYLLSPSRGGHKAAVQQLNTTVTQHPSTTSSCGTAPPQRNFNTFNKALPLPPTREQLVVDAMMLKALEGSE